MTAVIDLGLKWAHALTQRVVTDAVVLHHAAADGYHTAKLLNDIQYNCTHCKEWMQ